MAQLFATTGGPGGAVYHMSNGDLTLWTGEDGCGIPPLHRLTERGPLQHGDTDLDLRLDPRIIRLRFTLNAPDSSDYYIYRAALLHILRPSRTPVLWSWLLDNGDSRSIYGHVVNGPTFSSNDKAGFSQKCVAEIRCADPLFFDSAGFSVVFGLTAGAQAWAIPWPIPWPIGASTLNQTATITYGGTWRENPIVRIVGPITDPVITNQTTGDVLDFTGITIAAADMYTIDLRYGYKTITNVAGTNKIDDLTVTSDLATWSLEADPEASSGENIVTVTGSGATSATQVYFTGYERYIGL